MKLLVLGCNGQLGRCLKDQIVNKDYEVTFLSRMQMDITDLLTTRRDILKISPDIIINASAYTAVDNAEDDKEAANLINNIAVKNIADLCKELDSWLIHISTDYVFDGNTNIPYKENDQTNPKNIYGYTKLMGEQAIQSSLCKHLILRTSWVYSEYGSNFLKTMLKLAQNNDTLRVINDQVGCPTYAQDIAKSIVEILPSLRSTKLPTSIFHYCGHESCTWYEFAKEIFHQLDNYKTSIKQPILVPIATSEFPTKAIRPMYSVLNNNQIFKSFNVKNSNWKHGVSSSLKKIIKKC